MACGERHTLCAAEAAGDVDSDRTGPWRPRQITKAYGFGNNEYGQLGLGITKGEIGFLRNVAKVCGSSEGHCGTASPQRVARCTMKSRAEREPAAATVLSALQPEPIVFSSFRTFGKDVRQFHSTSAVRPAGPVRPRTPGKGRHTAGPRSPKPVWSPSAPVGAQAADSGLASVVQLAAGGRHSAAVVERVVHHADRTDSVEVRNVTPCRDSDHLTIWVGRHLSNPDIPGWLSVGEMPMRRRLPLQCHYRV